MAGIQIGRLLVEQGVLSRDQVRHILEVQKQSHRPFGDLAERLYDVDPRAVEGAWVKQYAQTAGIVDLAPETFDPACIALLNRRQAWQFHMLPIRHDGEAIRFATCPGDLVRCINFTARMIRGPVYFVLAERLQLREKLMEYFPVPQYVAEYAAQM